ncbi:hypothetical protein NPIL_173501 [Nephila pilipes]|uniref:Uncharacterized protein n=1 Tax=Nephila pilipes TaxID=299642 RepID=A0A8X6T6W9_NEPPI|nr:hypothetical protein NPIL_173501 [Nephila pilipes]
MESLRYPTAKYSYRPYNTFAEPLCLTENLSLSHKESTPIFRASWTLLVLLYIQDFSCLTLLASQSRPSITLSQQRLVVPRLYSLHLQPTSAKLISIFHIYPF